ncbi:MAG: hypothetical protein EXR59_00920, partial [Dehalococcoidia bacterium]|nr:hypothetical protein [Dehalococcoidia bacterium]
MEKNRLFLTALIISIFSLAFISACSGSDTPKNEGKTPGPGSVTPSTSGQQEGKPPNKASGGGILKVAYTGTVPKSSDPFTQSDILGQALIQPAYDGLVRYSGAPPNRTIVGDLATRWEFADDHTLVMHLQPNAKFHDGQPLTSEDVHFSISRSASPLSGTTSILRNRLSSIDRVETPDDYTVRIITKEPWASALNTLASPYMRIVPKHIASASPEGLAVVVVGSGPYIYKSYSPDVGAEFVKNKNYWDKGLPYLDGIRLSPINDPQTLLLAMSFGQIDLMFQPIDWDQVEQLTKLNSKVVLWRPIDTVSGPEVVLNTTRAPFDDIRVREAIRLAIDNDAMAKANPYSGKIQLNSPMGLTKWGLAEDTLSLRKENNRDRDGKIREAKRLLAEAGIQEGTSVRIMVGQGKYLFPNKKYGPDVKGQILMDNLKEIGLDAQIEVRKYPGEFNQELILFKYDIAVLYTPIDDYPDPDNLKDFWQSRGPRNYSASQSKDIDQLLYQESITLNADDRHSIIDHIQRLALDSYAAFYLPLSAPEGPGPVSAISQP